MTRPPRVRWLLAAVGALAVCCSGTATADDTAQPPLAHASVTTVDVTSSGATVRMFNDTAVRLHFKGPSVVPAADQPTDLDTAAFALELHVYRGTANAPQLIFGVEPVIPVGGYLELTVTPTDAVPTADATLVVGLQLIGTGGKVVNEPGQTLSVALHTGPVEAKTTAITPDVEDLTVTRTTHWLSRSWNPFAAHTDVDGATLPVTGDCPATTPAAELSSDAADTAEVTTTCTGQALRLEVAGVDRSGAEYAGKLRVGADDKTDVAVTLHQRLGQDIAILFALVGVLLGLFFQWWTKVFTVTRRLFAEVDDVDEATWVAPPALSMVATVRAKKAELRTAVRAVRYRHAVSLSDADLDVAALTADLLTLRQLQASWPSLVTSLRDLADAAQSAQSLLGTEQAEIVVATDQLLQVTDPGLTGLPDFVKQVVAQRRLLATWQHLADRLTPLAATAEGRKVWVRLREATDDAALGKVHDAYVELVVAVPDRRTDAVAADTDDPAAVPRRPAVLEPAGLTGLTATFLARESTRRTAARVARAVVGAVVVVLALVAVVWVEFALVWLGHDFGWTDAVTVLFFGMVTPAALDLVATALDRLRVGARIYLGAKA